MEGALYTQNISRDGILIAWRGADSPLPVPGVGQIMTIEIELPATHGFGQKCMHCQGTVTRVSYSDRDFPLVAMHVNYMDFRSFHEGIRPAEALQPAANSWMA